MDPGHWLSLFSVCLLGAMSPGPSLAVVMNSTLREGPAAGYACAVGHGAGVGLYGLATVSGLAGVIARSPGLFMALQVLGALYLLYLGYRSLRASGAEELREDSHRVGNRAPALNGFLVAFLNPKLAIFMLALFSQFLRPEADILEKGLMVATVGITDASWYSLVVALMTRGPFLKKLQAYDRVISRIFGIILILLGLSVIARVMLQVQL